MMHFVLYARTVLFSFSFVFTVYVVAFPCLRLSVPVQSIAWKDSSLKLAVVCPAES